MSARSSPLVLPVPAGAPPRRRARARHGWRWAFGLLLLAALLLLVVHRREEAELLRLLGHVRPAWLLLALVLQAGTYLADALAWQLPLRRAGQHPGGRTLLQLSLVKYFVDQLLPTGGVTGTLVVTQALARRGVPPAATALALLSRFLSYYLAYAPALAAGLWLATRGGHLPRGVLLAGVLLVLALAALPTGALLLLHRTHPTAPAWAQRLPLPADARAFVGTLVHSRPPPAGLLVRCSLAQAAVFLLDGATLWAALHALGLARSPPEAFAGFMLGCVGMLVSVVPSGTGTFDAATVAALGLFGVPLPAGVAATLLFRGVSFWLPLLPGLLATRREARAAGRG